MAVDEPRVAVVTGSSSGIGRAIALQLAADGYHVVVHAGSNRAAARQVADEIGELGRQSRVLVQDFAVAEALESFVQECWDWQGNVSAWVNNAGADVLTGDAARQSFISRLNTVLQVDVVATLVLSRSIGQKMRTAWDRDQQRRSIINIGWDQASHGMAGDSGEMFAASKGAIMACTKSLAQSLSPAVRVNCIAPGWIQTRWGQEASKQWQDRARDESLLNRWGHPRDIAGLARFLVADEADFVNGQVICVNGGFRMGRDEVTQPSLE